MHNNAVYPDAAYRRSLFNESASRTFVPSDLHSSVAYAATLFDGTLSNDVASLAGITVEQQEFLDARVVSPRGFISFYQLYDGVLGLGPFDPSDKPGLAKQPSLFKSIVREKLISSNVFSLELPRGKRFVEGSRTPGSLSFGQPRISLNAGNVIRLPLAAESIAEQTWYSPGTDLDWDRGRIQFQLGPSSPVQIDPGSLAIVLPSPLASKINEQISPPRALSDDGYYVDCNERSSLPSLVLTFEGSSRLELNPFDYTLERSFSNGTILGCMSSSLR